MAETSTSGATGEGYGGPIGQGMAYPVGLGGANGSATPTPSTSIGGGGGGGGRGAGFVSGESVLVTIVPSDPIPDFGWKVLYDGLVQFTDASITGPCLYLWDFGDGRNTYQKNPLHAYKKAGEYAVKLTLQGKTIRSITKTVVVTIDARQINILTTVAGFKLYCTYNGNFTPTAYLWNFGDGQSSNERDPTHIYSANGNYTVKLTADGLEYTTVITIDTEIVLAWQDNSSDETAFRIYHSLDGIAGWTLLATVGPGVTSYGVSQAVDGIDSSIVNYFKIVAYNGQESDPSNIVMCQCSEA